MVIRSVLVDTVKPCITLCTAHFEKTPPLIFAALGKVRKNPATVVDRAPRLKLVNLPSLRVVCQKEV